MSQPALQPRPVRPVLREQIKDVLLQRIVAGGYAPGQRLVETRIAQELGVSQAPVREALRDLEQVGCVVHEPYRGCSVRAVSPEELLEAFPVRQALESLAARSCAEQRDDGLVARLEAAVDEMRAAAGRGDALDEARADAGFHGTIVRGTGNATLVRQWVLLEPTLRTYITVSQPGTDLRVLAERHVPILEAIRRGDGDAAARAMVDHLAEAADGLRRALEGSHSR